MIRKQAKTLINLDINKVKEYLNQNSMNPRRDYAMFCLSRYAGLRACEISRLQWDMILDPFGELDDFIHLESKSTKGGYGGGIIPIHPELKLALSNLPKFSEGFVINSNRSDQMTAKSIVNFFLKLYKALNLKGCSSHSGRRTFITMAARSMRSSNASIKDLMGLSRHKHLSSLQVYIDVDVEAQKKMIFGQ